MRGLGRVRLPFLSRFGLDKRGVSAVEFALIAPVMILMYFGVGELCEGMMAQRRAAHATAAIGDLVTQGTSVSKSEMADIFAAATTILQPFPTKTLQLRMTSVTVSSLGNPTVDWSCAIGGLVANTAGTTYKGLPPGLISSVGESVVVAEGRYSWASPANYVVPSGMNFSPISYSKPRQSNQVTGPQSC